MQRITLIDPNYGFWKAGTICRHSQFEPLGIEYIGAKTQQAGYSVQVLQQRELTDDELVQEVLKFKPDVIGFSVVTCTYDRALQISKKIKKLCPKVFTVFGGYHATAMPGICKENTIDFVVIGEGEETFLELVQSLGSGKNPSGVKGVGFQNEKLVITPYRERFSDLNNLPFPIREKKILEECKLESLTWPLSSDQKCVAQILFSRGCSFACTFCCSPSLWGNQIRYRTPKNVIDEIKYLKREFGTNYFFFADLTFNLSRKKVYELCSEFIKSELEAKWYSMCRPENIDQEIISLMEKAGCTKIAYGIDGLNDATLKKIKPKQQITMEIIRQSLSITQASSIISRAFIIIGYPWETKEELLFAKELIKTLPIDDLRIAILTPLPGSIMYKKFKKERILLHEDFSKYTTEECVIKLKDMEREELDETREQIFKEFYQSKEYEQRMKEKIKKYPYLKQSYDEFFESLYSKDIFKRL
jgi:radical SAM superfamily enzyme YgiQ (UPF0313 family)